MESYFAVGDHVAVSGTLAGGTGTLVARAGGRCAELTFAGSAWQMVVELSAVTAAPAVAVEVARVGVRIAQKIAPGSPLVLRGPVDEPRALLIEDGFRPTWCSSWVRESGPFLRRGPLADHPDEVYEDPLSIPWNFVPAETSAYEPLLDDAPREVLEIGCGHGKNVRILAGAGHAVTGIELADLAIRRCRRHLDYVARFATADAASLPFAAASFDIVVDVGCMHCMPDSARRAAVLEAQRVLRPDGVLYSRIFKPRPSAWVAAQPFRAQRFGMTDAEVAALFDGHFEVQPWRDDEHMHFLRCRPVEVAR